MNGSQIIYKYSQIIHLIAILTIFEKFLDEESYLFAKQFSKFCNLCLTGSEHVR